MFSPRLTFPALVLLSLLGQGCSSPPPPTPAAHEQELKQLDEARERERSNK